MYVRLRASKWFQVTKGGSDRIMLWHSPEEITASKLLIIFPKMTVCMDLEFGGLMRAGNVMLCKECGTLIKIERYDALKESIIRK